MTEAVKQNLRHFKATDSRLYYSTINFVNEHKLWGTYYPEKGDYELAENRAHALVEHWEEFEWLYKILKDYGSKKFLLIYFATGLCQTPEE